LERVTAVVHPLLSEVEQPKPPARRFEERLQTLAASRVERPADVGRIDPLALVRSMLRQVETEFTLGEEALEKVLEAAKAGRELKPAELLGLQARMQRYDLQSQLMFKLVEQLVGIIKELLKTQV
jgi:hypothetical protein